MASLLFQKFLPQGRSREYLLPASGGHMQGGIATEASSRTHLLRKPNTLKLKHARTETAGLCNRISQNAFFRVLSSMFDVRCSMFDVRCSMFDDCVLFHRFISR